MKKLITRLTDALKSRSYSNPLPDAPAEVPEGATVLGECPQGVRGLWLQRVELTRDANAAKDKVRELEQQLAAAKKEARSLTKQHDLVGNVLSAAFEDEFDMSKHVGAIGITADWQVFSQPEDSGLGGLLHKLMSGKSVSGADIFQSVPDEIRARMLPEGYEVTAPEDLPEHIQKEVSGLGLSESDVILYNKSNGKVQVIALFSGMGFDNGMPGFMKAMMADGGMGNHATH